MIQWLTCGGAALRRRDVTCVCILHKQMCLSWMHCRKCRDVSVSVRQLERTLSQYKYNTAVFAYIHTYTVYRYVYTVYTQSAKTKMQGCVPCLPTQARLLLLLAENTNSAWGGSLKLETCPFYMALSNSGNHLVAHAYQVLSQTFSLLSAYLCLCCFVAASL